MLSISLALKTGFKKLVTMIFIALESGDLVLLESGDKIIPE